MTPSNLITSAETGPARELAAPDLAGLGFQGDDRFGPGAAGGGADLNQVGQGGLGGGFVANFALNHPPGFFHQLAHLQGMRGLRLGAIGRFNSSAPMPRPPM